MRCLGTRERQKSFDCLTLVLLDPSQCSCTPVSSCAMVRKDESSRYSRKPLAKRNPPDLILTALKCVRVLTQVLTLLPAKKGNGGRPSSKAMKATKAKAK